MMQAFNDEKMRYAGNQSGARGFSSSGMQDGKLLEHAEKQWRLTAAADVACRPDMQKAER